jgi:chemotaxis protein CheX
MNMAAKKSAGQHKERKSAEKAGSKPDNSALAATPYTIQLPDILNITAATPLAKTFLEHRGADIVADASKVQHLGAQGLQVLLSAARTWSADGVAFSLAGCSDRMLEDLKLFGVEPHNFSTAE